MRSELFLFLLSMAGAGLSVALGGPILTLPLATSLLAAFSALLILASALVRGSQSAPRFTPSKRPATARRLQPAGPHVVIDGSNVMHWNGETARLDTLREVIATLRIQGYQTGVIFDANAGYKLGGSYLDDRHFAKLLDLSNERVLVVGKGAPADPTILSAARELRAKVITNDRYRDWAADYPEMAKEGHLVRGGYRDGKLWLDDAALAGAEAAVA